MRDSDWNQHPLHHSVLDMCSEAWSVPSSHPYPSTPHPGHHKPPHLQGPEVGLAVVRVALGAKGVDDVRDPGRRLDGGHLAAQPRHRVRQAQRLGGAGRVYVHAGRAQVPRPQQLLPQPGHQLQVLFFKGVGRG